MSEIQELGDRILKQITLLGRKTADSMLPGMTDDNIHKATENVSTVK